MIYQVVSPFVYEIDGDSFKDAVKNFVKLHHNMSLANVIITDQYRTKYMKADLNYYSEGSRNKVGINLMPTVWNVSDSGMLVPNIWPYSPTISYDTTEYPATTFVDATFVPRIIPLAPLVDPLPALAPLVNLAALGGVIPTVIKY
jgi:hypothetical protein